MHSGFKQHLLEVTQASDCIELEVIQTLWSGYGEIARYQLKDSPRDTVVVKCISLQKAEDHPRGWNTQISHERKVNSYQVEHQWYERYSARCTHKCRVPQFISSYAQGEKQWIIMEDLDEDFPVRKSEVNLAETKACLSWLASFHMTFMQEKPKGLWPIGTYWHLATRPDEWEKMNHPSLKSKAHAIDAKLNDCQFKTFVHGDAKLANFCFSRSGEKVAAVDFQYIGGGCGMKDVAYLLGSCLNNDALENNISHLLDFYFSELKVAFESTNTSRLKLNDQSDFHFHALEEEWRGLFTYAWTDFTRFLLGWMPEHNKINDFSLKQVDQV